MVFRGYEKFNKQKYTSSFFCTIQINANLPPLAEHSNRTLYLLRMYQTGTVSIRELVLIAKMYGNIKFRSTPILTEYWSVQQVHYEDTCNSSLSSQADPGMKIVLLKKSFTSSSEVCCGLLKHTSILVN